MAEMTATTNVTETIPNMTSAETAAASSSVTPVATVASVADEFSQLLTKFGATETTLNAIKDLGVTCMDDLTLLSVEDLTGAGMKLIQAKKLKASLEPKAPSETASVAPTVTPAAKAAVSTAFFSAETLLPSVPIDEAWLNVLKTGGVLKVDQATYIAAIRAALADRTHIYDVPKKLIEALESYAYEADEPVAPDFYKLMRQLTRRNYGDLFAAIDGVDGTFVSEKRKKELISRINEYLWPAVAECYRQLYAWQQAWKNGFDPSILMAQYFGGGMPLPPGMAQIPDTSPLQDAGDSLRNALNKALAGTGSVVASAMAYEYNQIKTILSDSSLPSKIGVASREQMYKRLNIAVDASMIRSEVNIVRFIISFAQADTVTADTEASYYTALYMLGSQINWAQLGIDERRGGSFRYLDDGKL